MVKFKEAIKMAKLDSIIKDWQKLVNNLTQMGGELSESEAEFVRIMSTQCEMFMINHAGYFRVTNQVTGQEELVRN